MSKFVPLSTKYRPNHIDDIVGQQHLFGPGKILRKLVENKKIFSMILFGKPGIGKTSIAHAIANTLNMNFEELNASIHTKKDIDKILLKIKDSESIIVFVDEIHRLNKPKQDILLPFVESGDIILIGATTENTNISINPALRSRLKIFELQQITQEEIISKVKSIYNIEYKNLQINNIDEVILLIFNYSGYDLRSNLNMLEMIMETVSREEENIDLNIIKTSFMSSQIYYDKNAEEHYNLISALQKSIRGSDVDASLYYLSRLIVAGDLEIILRRLSIIAYEDISFGNHIAIGNVVTGINLCKEIGLPEASLILSNIVIELSLSPKSNRAYKALESALADVKQYKDLKIPKIMENNGIGNQNYKYPFDYDNNYVKQQYLPDQIKSHKYYYPEENSKYERSLKKQRIYYDKLKNMK